MEKLTQIQQINSAIMFGDFTNDQLNSILAAVKYRRTQMTKDFKRGLMVGDMVKFVHPKTGRTHTGNVVKIKIKNIAVREGTTTWNVPANLLSAIEG